MIYSQKKMKIKKGEWCSKWGVTVNGNKSKVMHFRSQNVDKTGFLFICDDVIFETIIQYKYLGAKPCLSLLLRAREICPNAYCGQGHGMVSTTAQTTALCNEKINQDVMYGQSFFDRVILYALKESIQQFL